MTKKDECIFCKIAHKEAKSTIVHETDDVIAFEDLNPQAPCHVLVIPKEHIASVNDVEPAHAEIMGKLFVAAREVAKKKGVDESGYRCVMNTGADVGQTVFHVHLHVLGGRAFGWPPG